MKLNQGRIGLVFGIFLAFMHGLWSLMVMLGFAQSYLNFVLGLHFLGNPFTVKTFNFGNAFILVGITFLVGYVFGWVFAMIWNKLRR